jgi:hypothetical protein
MQTSDDVDLTRITTVLLGADGTLFPSEDRADSASLARVLRPHPEVLATLAELRQRYQLAVVTSSALSRLEACFTASGLDEILPAALRFSAEDSLPVPAARRSISTPRSSWGSRPLELWWWRTRWRR